ncbi:MAG: solute:sodium symporter family transporter [Chlorobi bacterium]|nr:solute:sodium symporter family transporter [Chlorobiota bacterium]
MGFTLLDTASFVAFIVLVVGISLYASRKQESSEDYFLAGRKLTWWLIGISLIASNISTEHFVGMSGQGFSLGLAVASFEWMAAVALIVVALVLLPIFLKIGIYTLPEFLEYRYNKKAKLVMACFMLAFYVFVTMATVLYSGALALKSIFGIKIIYGIWFIGIIAGGYTVYGGLKAVVWSDLVQGITLLSVGLLVMFLSFQKIGGYERFVELSGGKLHTILPWNHPKMPWISVFLGGLWIQNLFYWGLNQFISQRTLGAKNLLEGQKGILFGATLKLLIPFIVVFPGIIAFELFRDQITNADAAYPYLIQKILPSGLMGLMFAALFGAVMSTLDSLLNSATTIFTMDIYKPYFNKNSSPKHLVKVGRIVTIFFVLLGCLWSPVVGKFEGGLYFFLQVYWGFVIPGIVSVFFLGIMWNKVPAIAAIWGMLLNIPIYGLCIFFMPDVSYLHHMEITFAIITLFIIIVTKIKPLEKPVKFPERNEIKLKINNTIKIWSALIIIAITALYIIFF